MNLFAIKFGTRPPSMVPAQTVYLRPGESVPLRTAIEIVSTTIDSEFVALSMSHYSGYVREAAIGRAVELGSSTFLSGDGPRRAFRIDTSTTSRPHVGHAHGSSSMAF